MRKLVKNVVVDIRKIQNLNSGLGQFCFHLKETLLKSNSSESSLSFWGSENENVNSVSNSLLFLNKVFNNKILKIDVWHAIHQEANLFFVPKSCRVILTVHDLNFLQKYSGWKLKHHLYSMAKKIERADVVVAISNFTKQEIEKHFKLGGKSVEVIYNGLNKYNDNTPLDIPFLSDKKFMFSIGIVQPKKNFHVLLGLLLENKDLHLVIAGDKSSRYADEIAEKAEKMKVGNRLHLLGKVNDAQKHWLYKNCHSFAFPSLAEGFGMPVVEALSLGKPVFLSNRCSLPEIAGDSAFYWDDFEPNSMNFVFNRGLEKFYSDSSFKERAMLQSRRFSWKEAAKKYLKLYEEL